MVLKNFEEWLKAKHSTTEEPLNFLLTDNPAVLCETLCVYGCRCRSSFINTEAFMKRCAFMDVGVVAGSHVWKN